MAFPPQFLDELKTRVSVVEVVGKSVKLVRKGRDYWACCPFHNEKTPSFSVSDEKGFYHCFSCGAHGSAIDFVMNTQGMSFPEAVKYLADQAGLQVPEETPEQRERAKRAENLYEVMELAAAFYEKQLRMPSGREALSYLLGRGLSEATIAKFRIGFAPDNREGLKAALSKEGVSDAQMVEAGLRIQPDDPGRKPYDRFRGRVMFPITDQRGRVVAFGGRIMSSDTDAPKYLNSPETPLFHKGYMVYGLQMAREAARKAGTMIVTEGYMDVIALAQGGFGNAVAPLGTALTEEQISLLWRIVREPILCFDGDQAGQRAAGRALERALPILKPGQGLRFAVLPPGEDPDSLLQKKGAKAMQAVLNEAVPISEQLWCMETVGQSLKSPEERGWLEKRLKDHVFTIKDEDLRGHYLRDIKDRLFQLGRGQGGGPAGPARRRNGGKGWGRLWSAEQNPHQTQLELKSGQNVKVARKVRQEEILLATLINHPGLFDVLEERLGMEQFSDPALDKFRQAVLNTLGENPSLDFEGLVSHLKCDGFEDVSRFSSKEVYAHTGFARPERSEQEALKGWEHTFRLYRVETVRAQLAEATRRLEEETTEENFELVRELNAELLRLEAQDEDLDRY